MPATLKHAALMLALVWLLAAFGSEPWETNNAFAAEHHKWAALRNARVSSEFTRGTISYPEMMEWQQVKSYWRQLEKQVDAEYRGEIR